jgi:hypothetical protein
VEGLAAVDVVDRARVVVPGLGRKETLVRFPRFLIGEWLLE